MLNNHVMQKRSYHLGTRGGSGEERTSELRPEGQAGPTRHRAGLRAGGAVSGAAQITEAVVPAERRVQSEGEECVSRMKSKASKAGCKGATCAVPRRSGRFAGSKGNSD